MDKKRLQLSIQTVKENIAILESQEPEDAGYYLQLEHEKMVLDALEKQIPQKPYKVKEHKQNYYYCTVCKCYLGNEMELKYACLQPEYCRYCGQSLDWLDHPTEKGGEG